MTATLVGPAPATTIGAPSFWRDSAVLFGRNARRYLKGTFVVTAVVIPLVFFAGFYAVLNKLLDVRGIDYAQFLPPAIAVQSCMDSAIGSAANWATDRRTGMLERFRSLPVAQSAIPAGRIGVDAARAVVSTVVVSVAAYAVGFRFDGSPVELVLYLALAAGLTVALALGTTAIALSVPNPEAAASILVLPYMPLLNFSTAFVPAEAFPSWLEPLVEASPISAVIDAMRDLASGTATGADLGPAVAWIIGLTLVFGTLATRSLRRSA